ncbi:MAG: amidase [Tranquillimonas sp.]
MERPLHDRPATDLCRDIAAGRLSPVVLAEAVLERIAAANPRVNAIVSLRPRDEILAEAQKAAEATPKGPLHGLPVAVKDLADTAGLRTTYGSPLFKDHVPAADGLLAARLRAAGAIIIGKTNTPEFGLGSHTYNPVFGATLNPYAPSRTAGGSSGGAAVALAARMLPLADGSDMMGSLRNPAGWNNVYGFRPSHGLVPSLASDEGFLHPLSTDGPMARDVRDLDLLLRAMAGPHPQDPLSGARHDGGDRPDIRGLRIGWLGDWGGHYAYEAGIADLCEAALGVLSDLGCDVRPHRPQIEPEALWQSWTVLRSWAMAEKFRHAFADPAKREAMKPAVQWEIERGLSLSGAEIAQAGRVRTRWFREAAEMRPDILTAPTAQMFPFDAALDWPEEVAGRKMDTYHRWMEVMIPASLAGLPALAVPAGFGPEGLPMGMQLIGRRGADATVLALGEAYHEVTRWPQRRPPSL